MPTSDHSDRLGHLKIKPLSELGVFYIPPPAVLRQLQSLSAHGDSKAYTDYLYPVIAHVLMLPLTQVAALFRDVLAISDGGRNLHGLESVFLSCLQSLQRPTRNISDNQQLAYAGLSAWDRHRPEKSRHPLVIANRLTNQLMYVPANSSHLVDRI
jgi:hypothetical protein